MRVSLCAALVSAGLLVVAGTPAVSSARWAPIFSLSNGEAAKPVGQILADVKAAALAAKTVHVVGGGTRNGQDLEIDLRLVAGKGGQGHISLGSMSFDMIRIGTKAYFRAGASFWRQFGGEAAATLFNGKWIVASATTGDLASFTPLTDLVRLMTGILSSSHGQLTKSTATIGGQAAVGLVDVDQGGTLYLAATGKPYPLELSPGNGKKGTIDFTDWDAPVTLTAPKNAIDYAKLKSGGG